MSLPVGKLPPALLQALLERYARPDPRLILGPGLGLDCAVIDFGDRLLVAKSDPITFATDEIGWYAVHVNANDVVTTGARPRWFLAAVLLPERCEPDLAESVFAQMDSACREVGAVLVGGHTEITSGFDRPVLVGTMLGEVAPDSLITPRGARPGDRLLLSKGVPIEGGSILAREFPHLLQDVPQGVLLRARDYLHDPGISVVAEALAAAAAGGVSAMHDPTEGGLAGGLWELADAAGLAIEVDLQAVTMLPEAAALCARLGLDPLAVIASGALLIAVQPSAASTVAAAIRSAGVDVSEIGHLREGQGVWSRAIPSTPPNEQAEAVTLRPLPRPERDALAQMFDPAAPTTT